MNRLPLDHETLAGLCRRHHIRRLSLFGSMLRREGGADSDVDLLVEFDPGKAPGLLGLAGIEAELSRPARRTPGGSAYRQGPQPPLPE